MQAKKEVFGSILEQREAMHKDDWNVVTSQCHDVPTSRPHVVTSQRRDVGSTYIEVNKQQRRDVSTSRRQREFCLSIIKSKKGTRIREIGDRGTYELGHENHNSSDFDLGEGPSFCIFLLFWIKVLMFYKLNIGVLIFRMF